jgi:hypothetical protein
VLVSLSASLKIEASAKHSARAYLAAGRKRWGRAEKYLKNNGIFTANLLGSLQVL